MPSENRFRLWFIFLLGIATALLISRVIPGKNNPLYPKSNSSTEAASGSHSAAASSGPDSTKATKSQRESSTGPKHAYLSADETEKTFRRLLANPPSTDRFKEILGLTQSLSAEVMLEFIDQDRWEFLRSGLTEQEANQIGIALPGPLCRDGTRAQFIFLLNHSDSVFFPFNVSELAEGMTRVMDAREAYDALTKGNLSEKQQKDFRRYTAYAFGDKNPQQFLSLAYEKEGQKILSENGSNFVAAWSNKSPTEAIEWTLTLAHGSEEEQSLRKSLINQAMGLWMSNDSFQASKWLAARPRDENTDRLTTILATSLLGSREYDSAQSWAGTIQDEAMKKKTLDSIQHRRDSEKK